MSRLDCTASTKKVEVINFCNKHKGKTIVVNFEHNIYPDRWGDDDIATYPPDKFDSLMKLVNTHYIHGVWTANKR